ncbi:hypothetical protein GRAN_4569 [Granulicella sibirica]|uniref:Uncharacterized protein n=1 Tax=Granulicella sibirica TaxID=2479048 RepID=A0A4Q0STH4_9BACT|nr:hypothetical protein GRAN_4569 [Granulicella sibirica]
MQNSQDVLATVSGHVSLGGTAYAHTRRSMRGSAVRIKTKRPKSLTNQWITCTNHGSGRYGTRPCLVWRRAAKRGDPSGAGHEGFILRFPLH